MALRDLPESTVSLVHVWHCAPGPMGRLSHCCCSDCAKLCTVRRTNAPPSLCACVRVRVRYQVSAGVEKTCKELMAYVQGGELIAGRWSEAKQLHAARRAVEEEGEDEGVQDTRILLGRKQRAHEHERPLVFHQQARYLDFVIYEHARPVVGGKVRFIATSAAFRCAFSSDNGWLM